MSWDSNSTRSNQSGTHSLVLPGSCFTSPGNEKRTVKQSARRKKGAWHLRKFKRKSRKERQEEEIKCSRERGGVTHGSCHLSTSSFPCASPRRPLARRLHSAPLPAPPAAAGASCRRTCLHPKLASGLQQQRVEGRGDRCPTLSHASHSCMDRSKTKTKRPPPARLPSER